MIRQRSLPTRPLFIRAWRAPNGVYTVGTDGIDPDGRPILVMGHYRYVWSRQAYASQPSIRAWWPTDATLWEVFAWDIADLFAAAGLRAPRFRSRQLPPHTRYVPETWASIQRWSALVADEVIVAQLRTRHVAQTVAPISLLFASYSASQSLIDLETAGYYPHLSHIRMMDGDPDQILRSWEAFIADPMSFLAVHLLL